MLLPTKREKVVKGMTFGNVDVSNIVQHHFDLITFETMTVPLH
jgi:hypothetical protein